MIGETVVNLMFTYDRITLPAENTAVNRIAVLFREGLLTQDLVDILHALRKVRNKAVHENYASVVDGKVIYYSPSDFDMNLLDLMADNIKEDRTPEDLLFQVMLDLGVELSSKIEETTIGGKKVFDVADGFLIACFDKDVNDETIKAIAQKQPYYFVMRDSSLANDSVATNFEQIFATYSPDTVRKVL